MPDRKHVIFLSQFGEEGSYNPDMFAGLAGGDNEIEWVRAMLDQIGVLDQITYSGRRATHGDPLPHPDEADAVILGGSFHNVSERLPWQLELLDWLETYRESGKPLMGICGGHQLMSTMMGSNVGGVPNAPMNASMPVELTDAGRGHYLFDDLGEAPVFHFGNYEHVETAPEGAVVLAVRPEMPAMALDYGNDWVSVQFHPEAAHDLFAASWRDSHPEFMENYYELPEAPLMLRNFLAGTGIISK